MTSTVTGRDVQPDWELCSQMARKYGRSFFVASRLLPGERRRSILAAYAFCRIADDIVDQSSSGVEQTLAALHAWEDQIDDPVHPVAIAFAVARMRYEIPERPVRELFDGMRADLTGDQYPTWSELHRYCYQVAGTVGLIVAPILGCSDSFALPRAAELGIAMQLTNILRDVGEDAAMGRIYLPLEELDYFGVAPDDLLRSTPGDGFQDLMVFQIERARRLYRQALDGVPALSTCGRLTTLTAAHLYAGILDQIEANNFDVFARRAVVSRAGKARLSSLAARQFIWGSVPVVGTRDVGRAAAVSLALDPDAEA